MKRQIYRLWKIFQKLRSEGNIVLLRQLLYHLGNYVIIDPTAHFENPNQIIIGDYCQVYRGAVIVGKSSAQIGVTLGERTTIREYAHINAYSGYITTGSNVYIGQGSVVSGHGGIEIGDKTLIGNLCSITSSNHIFSNKDVPLRFQGETSVGIKIGKNAWIASQVSILDGITIGDNAVVSSGSLVAKDIPAWAIAAGVPARIVKDRRE